jgi:tRNA (guanine6-N2)-methyltransferase
MRALFICDKGNEDILEAYIDDVSDAQNITRITQGCLFETQIEDFIPLTYLNQLCLKQFAVITSFDYHAETITQDLQTHTESHDFSEWLDKDHSFKVICKIPNADTQKIAQEFGAHIFRKSESFVVEMKRPSVEIRIQHLHGKIFVCYDLTGQNDEKREYKIFNSPTALRATIGAALTYDIDDDEVILDPFCGSGTILIETALLRSRRSPNFYLKDEFPLKRMKPFAQLPIDEMLEEVDSELTNDTKKIIGADILAKSVDATKKNAKIAGVLKQLDVFRADIDWIDMKFEEEPVDIIVTNPPLFSEHNMDKVIKTYQQFFKRIPDVLSEDGEVRILTNNAQKVIELSEGLFEKHNTYELFMGKTPLTIVSFTKIKQTKTIKETH